MRPVFVGGTGRSGTTITAKLIGAHPAYRMIPIETRFIGGQHGLCDVVDGRTSFREFEKRMLGQWFHRVVNGNETRGLHKLVERRELEAGLRRLRDGMRSDVRGAAEAFVHELLDPLAEADGALGWIEMSPPNVLAGPRLLRLFPDMKLIHSVRDGRDVACSVVGLHWGPDNVDDALDWWADRLERGYAACEGLPSDRLLTLHMEDLVARNRDEEYARLLAFLGLEDDPAMRTFFVSQMDPGKAHIGRWVDDVPPERRPAFDGHYQALVDQLRRRGRPVPVEGLVAT